MGKIKNWSRNKDAERKSKNEYYWEHDKTGDYVIVENSASGDYLTTIQPALFTKEYSSKEDAREKAVNWMKKHPHPIVPKLVCQNLPLKKSNNINNI